VRIAGLDGGQDTGNFVHEVRITTGKTMGNQEHLEKDKDLDSLRSRADFQKLLRPHKKSLGRTDG
jgi:hypothetical protein